MSLASPATSLKPTVNPVYLPDYQGCHRLSEPLQKLVVRKGAERAVFRLGRDEIPLPRPVAHAAHAPSLSEHALCK